MDAHDFFWLNNKLLVFQICSGIDENAVGACSELIFAPIDEMFPDDAPLLPSGFRIIPLDSRTVEYNCFVWICCSFPYSISGKILDVNIIILAVSISFILEY